MHLRTHNNDFDILPRSVHNSAKFEKEKNQYKSRPVYLHGSGEIRWGVPKIFARFWLKRDYMKIQTPNSPCTDNTVFFGIFYEFLQFVVWPNSGHFWGVYKSLLHVRRCISFFFCLCNVSTFCFLFVCKANKVNVRE